MKNTSVVYKNKELVSILSGHFPGKFNLARVKFISLFITALIKVQTVNYDKIASAFDSSVQRTSSLRRIQRFIADFALPDDLIPRLIFSLLPQKSNLTLSIDRTNWDFGTTKINIFMLSVAYSGVAFPLMFSLLPKKGNSNTKERIELIERFIALFGQQSIKDIVADREFVGEEWTKYLNDKGITYYIRIRNNFKVFIPHKNELVKASWLFNTHKTNQMRYYDKIVRINNQLCYISGMKLNDGDYLILISYKRPENSQLEYAKRWQIEMTFKSLKTSGFNLEDTHLTDLNRIGKLLSLITIAFVWAYKVGIYVNDHIKPIVIKSHGRRAKSLFKYGLEIIARTLFNGRNEQNINVLNFLSCT